MILLMVLLNFIFSMWLVLFIISVFNVFSDIVFFCRWFSKCFGVVMIICGVCCNELCCILNGWLLYNVKILVFGRKCVSWCNLFVIWFVSLCVGYSIKVWVWNSDVLICCNKLRLKVVVLLLLVFVCMWIFFLVRIVGSAAVCIGVMVK